MKETESNTQAVEGESELVMELRDYAQQIGMNPTDKEFRSVAVDYIQKKAVGVLDEKAGPSRRLLDNKENADKYKGMLDETFAAFNYNDAESDDFRRHAIDPDQLKPLDDKYYRDSKGFAEMQQEYRNVHATTAADKAAFIHNKNKEAEKENVQGSDESINLSQEELASKYQEDDLGVKVEQFTKPNLVPMKPYEKLTESEHSAIGAVDYNGNPYDIEKDLNGHMISMGKDGDGNPDLYPIGNDTLNSKYKMVADVTNYSDDQISPTYDGSTEGVQYGIKVDPVNMVDSKSFGMKAGDTIDDPWGSNQIVSENGAYLVIEDSGSMYMVQKEQDGNPIAYEKVPEEYYQRITDNLVSSAEEASVRLEEHKKSMPDLNEYLDWLRKQPGIHSSEKQGM